MIDTESTMIGDSTFFIRGVGGDPISRKYNDVASKLEDNVVVLGSVLIAMGLVQIVRISMSPTISMAAPIIDGTFLLIIWLLWDMALRRANKKDNEVVNESPNKLFYLRVVLLVLTVIVFTFGGYVNIFQRGAYKV